MKLKAPTVTQLFTYQGISSIRAKVVFNSDEGFEGVVVQLELVVTAGESLDSIKSRAIEQAMSLLAVRTFEPEPEICIDYIDDPPSGS